MHQEPAADRWLVLLYQFPKGPGSRRVRFWRRLQAMGAVAVKNSVYVLPNVDQSREDFEWLLRELQAAGADAAILESRFVDGMNDAQIVQLFNDARAQDYRSLLEDVQAEHAAPPADSKGGQHGRRTLARARKRLAEIEAIDFFGAPGREAVSASLQSLAQQLSGGPARGGGGLMGTAPAHLRDLQGRTWVTRQGVQVDRIASAWLIRRFIDPAARFRFAAGKDYVPGPGDIRFDMYEAEYTHVGDRCTFEVLADLVAPNDAALHSVAEVVHDIDLKEEKFGRPETAGVAHLLAGAIAETEDDEARIDQGSALFEHLYRSYGGT